LLEKLKLGEGTPDVVGVSGALTVKVVGVVLDEVLLLVVVVLPDVVLFDVVLLAVVLLLGVVPGVVPPPPPPQAVKASRHTEDARQSAPLRTVSMKSP
jgi:hypothetical protein